LTVGSNARSLGSVHSDTWRDTAINIATCNLISVFPVIGWWRQRSHLKQFNNRTRYSLILSLETPAQEIDLYNAVKAKIKVPVEIE
jgi:hypothetical protein